MGISRIESNKKDKNTLLLATKDFKQGYLKEKNTIHAIDCKRILFKSSTDSSGNDHDLSKVKSCQKNNLSFR